MGKGCGSNWLGGDRIIETLNAHLRGVDRGHRAGNGIWILLEDGDGLGDLGDGDCDKIPHSDGRTCWCRPEAESFSEETRSRRGYSRLSNGQETSFSECGDKSKQED